MKKHDILLFLSFISLFLLSFCQTFGQEIPVSVKGQAEFVDMSFVDSTNKEVLYERAMAFIKQNYDGIGKATQIKNQTEWIIVAKTKTEKYRYLFKGKDMKVGYFSYVFSIHCKDTKYKCIINEIQYDSNALPDLIGTDLSATQPFKSEKYVEDGFLQIWTFLRTNVTKDLLKELAELRIFMLSELPK
jgi:hypothetical protein